MESRKIYGVFYILLLTITVPALCAKLKYDEALKQDMGEESQVRERRQAILPIAAYAGMAVAPWLFAALVAAYGLALVHQYAITKQSSNDSHTCANNRGWCRSSCFSHEYSDWWNSAVCGSYKCCRPK